MQNESEVYTRMMCGFVDSMVFWLRKIPDAQWDWTPAVSAPTARQVAAHTLVTLICDRQHVGQPDVLLHPLVPDPPESTAALCEALESEANWWREWLSRQAPESYLQPRKQFGISLVNVRWIVFHTMQQVVYKTGQLSTLYYALGLDGTEPYEAPQPNTYYLQYRELIEDPLVKAILRDEAEEVERLVQSGADPNAPTADGRPPLTLAIGQRNVATVRALLAHGADPDAKDLGGYSPREAAARTKDAALLALFPPKEA